MAEPSRTNNGASMKQSNRRKQPGTIDPLLMLWAIAAVAIVMALLVFLGGLHIGYMIDGIDRDTIPTNPFKIVIELAQGELRWSTASTVAAVAICIVLAFILVLFIIDRVRVRRGRLPIDQMARFMGHGKDVKPFSEKQIRKKATAWGVESATPGIPVGRSVVCGTDLFASYEDMMAVIAGPRMNKTTATVIPAICQAPGAVLTTSNKRDVVDATRQLRSKTGDVWVFDPQQIAQEEPTWWWNPLSYVTDDVQAAKLAEHFAAASSSPGAKKDAYFDNAARDLLAALLLAAAEDHRPITDVYLWLTDFSDETAVDSLKAAGWDLLANQLDQVVNLPDKQRAGIYGSAQQMATCLANSSVTDWITPRSMSDQRPQFEPYQFVRSATDTLYSLSKEGQGTAGPLVTALTVAVVEAAEDIASSSSDPAATGQGRLKTPLVGVLDEAANVCRWSDLPDLYSHFGSRGVVLMTLLQSWSQGVDTWDESGMKKLWSAANVKLYGGNNAETGFLESLSDLIGTWDKETRSISTGRGQRSVSTQLSRERILEVAELSSLPKERGIMIGAGIRPTMVKTTPWFEQPELAHQLNLAKRDSQEHTVQDAVHIGSGQ